jgi:hypothetical protein
MNKHNLYILLLLVFIACKKENQLAINDTDINIKMDSKTFTGSNPKNCKGNYNCSEINIQTLIIEEKSTVNDSINAKILRTISKSLSSGEEKNYDDIIKVFTTNFIRNHNELKREFPKDSVVSWSANSQTKMIAQSEKLLDICINYDVFTGGAHGYAATISLLFDKSTGEIIPQDKLFSDVEAVTKIAEHKFRENQQLDSKIELEEAGYFFEKNKFKLAQNILYTKNGIVLVYNQYEAAPYAQGQIEVEIPYKDIKKYMLIK